MPVSKKVIFLLLILQSFRVVTAGNPVLNSRQELTVDEIVAVLEELHSTRIFYESEWFEGYTFSGQVTLLPLDQAVAAIIRGQNLAALDVEGYVVIIPLELSAAQFQAHDTLMLTIGDPSEFGRYNWVDLKGRILDGTTGESLPGAVIYSEKTGRGSSSDPDGNYSINLPVGELLIRLSYVGYEDQYRRVNLMGPGEHDFHLFEETQRIDEVTIMARRAEANITRTQMSVINMDSRVLKVLPGNLGEQDIIKSMTLLPGVQSVGEFGTGLNVRGGSSDQNLILLEGTPLFNTSHLFGLISVVNPDMISEMTLYKGGIPAKYGERASSVMDIRVNPGNLREFKLTGGIGLINSRVHMEAPLVKDKVSLSVGGRSSYSNWLLDRIPAEELLNSSAGFYDISALLSVSSGQKNTVSLFAYHSDDKFSYGGDTEFGYSNTLASLRWNRVLGEKFSLNVAGGLSLYDYNVMETLQSSALEAFSLGSSVGYHSLKGSLLWFPDGNHRVEFGMNAIRYGIAPGNLEPLASPSQIVRSRVEHENGAELSMFISDEFEITDRISTEIGLRYTGYMHLGPSTVYIYNDDQPKRVDSITDTLTFGRNEITKWYGGFEPRLSFRYNITASSSVKASFTRNNQYLNLVSNTTVMTPSDLWKLSDHHLKPLSSDNYAVGYFKNFRNNSIETSVEIYFRNIRNIVEYREGAEILMNRYIETDLINARGYGYGAEFYAGKNSGRLTGWLSYTFSSSQVRSNSVFQADRINDNNYFPSSYDKPHEIILNASYNISRRWRIGATFSYNTGRPVTLPELYFPFGDRNLVYYSDRNKYRIPPHHRLDISLTRDETLRINKRRSGNWTISVINLYGRKNPYSVFYDREPSGPWLGRESFSLYKLYIIGRPLPTLTYNFRF